jgi:hypothetical protein
MSEALTFEGSLATNGLVQDNYIHDTDQLGATSYKGANNITFRHNKLEHISIQRNGKIWFNHPSVALYADSGYSILMEQNLVSDAGVGIEALSEPGQPPTHDVTVRNNVVRDCQKGIVLGTWYSSTDGSSVSRINVWNNTFYGNATGVVIRPMLSSTVRWANNIFASNGMTYVNSLQWDPGTVGYNLYFGGGTGPGNNNVISDPLFVNASGGDFSLQARSPAIGAGDPSSPASAVGAADFAGHPRVTGGRVDIGAYEVQ